MTDNRCWCVTLRKEESHLSEEVEIGDKEIGDLKLEQLLEEFCQLTTHNKQPTPALP